MRGEFCWGQFTPIPVSSTGQALTFPHQGGREKRGWIPACAGMTKGVAGMTEGVAGMTEGVAGEGIRGGEGDVSG